MRSLAVWTTTAAVALICGAAASAQTTAASANAAAAATTAAPAPAGDDSLHTALAAYASYQTDVTNLRDHPVSTNAQLENALDRVGRHNRDALTRGWVAYGAYTAAQSQAFMQGVRDAAAYYGRDAVIWAITVDPSYARGLRGGQDATAMMISSAVADSARITTVADQYHDLAYSLQRQHWANTVAPQQSARVQRVRSLAAADAPAAALPDGVAPHLNVAILTLSPNSDPTVFGGKRFWDTVQSGAAHSGNVVEVSSTPVTYRANPPRSPALDRMAAVAALQALNVTDSMQSQVSQLLDDPRSRDCFEMAQLQLYQCMSAAHFRFENAFCLGEHGLREMGTCIGAVATPDTSAMTPLPAAPASRP
jgi:hypothetical protein